MLFALTTDPAQQDATRKLHDEIMSILKGIDETIRTTTSEDDVPDELKGILDIDPHAANIAIVMADNKMCLDVT